MNCDTPINHKDGIATIQAMSGWPMRPAFHLYKHLYKHHRRIMRRMFRGHPSLCAGRVTLCDPAPSDAMTKTLAITGIWGYRHCARVAQRDATRAQ